MGMGEVPGNARSRSLARKRRANVPGGRKHAHLVKVTPEEEAALQMKAAKQNTHVVRLMVESALSDEPGETVTERREFVAHLFELQRLLSNVANNVNQLAKWANTTGEVGADLHETLAETRAVYERIDEALDWFSRRGGAGA